MTLLVSLKLELIKIFRQRGSWVGNGILATVVTLMCWGLWAHGPVRGVGRSFGRDMAVGGRILSGVTPARHIMEPALIILVPMLIAAIAGGLIAGEGKAGVLRTWLCRPVTRITLITSKQLAAWIHAISLTLFLGVIALLVGHAFFGTGDLVDFRSGDGMVILDEVLALKRLALAYGLASLVMCAIASLALLASVIFENPMVAAASAVAFLPVSTIIGSIEYFEFLKPYLLTRYMDFWIPAFRATLDFADFRSGLWCVAGYCLVPYILAMLLFWRKDITS